MLAESSRARSLVFLLTLGVSVVVLGGCTKAPVQNVNKNEAAESSVDDDPLEPFNRIMHGFNQALDTVILKPVTEVYHFVVPEKGREAVSNAIDNLYTPVVFANSVLQADPQNSFASFFRFVINSSWGIGGLFDVASAGGLKYRQTDFGQTLGIHGSGSGPYIVLPIIGPSTARDAVGRLADACINPFNHVDEGASIALWSATAVDARSRNSKLIDDIYRTSLDSYSTFRSGYLQKRASDIRRAKASRDQALDKARVQ